MGKSHSIQEQQKSNTSFQEYVTAMTKDMDDQVEKMTKTIESMVDAHYQPWSDKVLLLEGRYSHLSTLSEWSLDSVNKIIDSCRNALFGAPAPTDSQKHEQNPEVVTSISAIKSRELLIANAAFSMIQGILGSFSLSISTSIEAKIDAKPLSPGLTLFIGIVNNSYSRKDFFNAEKIMQNIFTYKVFYSIKEGESQSKLGDLESYEDQKVAFREQLKKVDAAVINLDILSSDYIERLKVFESIADGLNMRLEAIGKKIAQLSGSNVLRAPKAEWDESKEIVARIRSRCQAVTLF